MANLLLKNFLEISLKVFRFKGFLCSRRVKGNLASLLFDKCRQETVISG